MNDTVQLLEVLPDRTVGKGAIGVVVAQFTVPDEAYRIRFCDHNGATITTATLRPDQFILMR